MTALVAGPDGRAVTDVALITPAARLRGELRLPGDKSISHRALMLALLARGNSRIEGAGDGADIRSTAAVVAALGASVEAKRTTTASGGELDHHGSETRSEVVTYSVTSPGIDALGEPVGILDCGNSGTTLRLFAGILAGQPMRAVLDGDDSLRRRPVARIIEPLRSMGAALEARQQDSLPPLTVVGRNPLTAVDWAVAVPSAQVKSAILLAGLRASGTTRVREPVATRDHTERMLRARGVTVRSEAQPSGGRRIEIEGGAAVQAVDERVPGDVSAAAFWLVAAAIHPDAELTIRGVGVNPTRRAVIDLLRSMGAEIEERPSPAAAGVGARTDAAAEVDAEVGEPVADLVVRSSSLRAIDLGPAEVAAAIDELPILCLAATQATGRTTIRGAGELRHKESDRLAGIALGLGALGARIELDGDDLTIDGPTRLDGAATDSLGDHRLALTFAVAGLVATGRTTVEGAASAGISYPGFFTALEGLRS
ncbi:MAG: 3-phosphoshikimate 1-carboxyvinyltransferase [Chloroflexota bacterium]